MSKQDLTLFWDTTNEKGLKEENNQNFEKKKKNWRWGYNLTLPAYNGFRQDKAVDPSNL